MRLVFLLEEPSMKGLLDVIVPPMLPPGVYYEPPKVYQGKKDLAVRFQARLRADNRPDTCFVLLHDRDHVDCRKLKQDLRAKCPPDKPVLIRIICENLESWLLGDAQAVRAAYGISFKKPPRQPDDLPDPTARLNSLTGKQSKVKRAREIAQHMNPADNTSKSFQVFLSGLNRLIAQHTT